ncbi:unnamed protein product [Schistocephalus solidus]|uniref:Fanconi-associated nuclease n=1 Tax=Schistocephalus solidus TaxID=70667 RepID=A0A183S843_SCHSO|nr:unnamed protein product [Schistocephalus solidus]
MNSCRLTDENNRVLETILFELGQKRWDLAADERSCKIFKRDPSSSREAMLTREPEVNHVQRLQRLYEGLASYALWYEAKVAATDGASLTAKADRAIYRLSEVDALIEDGHVCDIFLRPFIHKLVIVMAAIMPDLAGLDDDAVCASPRVMIRGRRPGQLNPLSLPLLWTVGRHSEALIVLEKYARVVHGHPNTQLYLAEWQLWRLTGKPTSFTSASLRRTLHLPRPSLECLQAQVETVGRQSEARRLKSPGKSAEETLLHHLCSYLFSLLPEPAPRLPAVDSDEEEEVETDDALLDEHNLALVAIEALLQKGWILLLEAVLPRCSCYALTALKMAFLLLDHPSWCRFPRPWYLLHLSINVVGRASRHVSKAWTLRSATWKRYIFSRKDIPPVGLSVKRVLKEVQLAEPPASMAVVEDDFAPILSVRKILPTERVYD